MSKAKLFIVEDELVITLGIRRSLEKLGYEVIGVAIKGEEAVELVRAMKPDLVLMDIILAGAMDGIEAARRIQKDADMPIIYLTANADSATVERARDTMPYGYLNKPINERDLLTSIDTALDKHRMEQRLRESEEKYRNLINSLQDVIVSADENGVITYVSPRINDIAGFEEDEMVGRGFLAFVHPEDREKVIRLFGLSKAGTHEFGEYRGITKSGGVIWLRTSGRPSFVDGRFTGVKVVISDITGQKQAEEKAMRANDELTAANEELQATNEELEAINEQFEEQNRELTLAKENLTRQEAMLRNIIRVVPVGIGFIKDRMVVWTNSTYQGMFGYSDEEITGKTLRMFYNTDDEFQTAVREMVRQIRARGWASFEVRARKKDGTMVDVHLNTAPMEKDNLDAGIVFAALDITEQKRAEEALRESEERYRLLIENMSDSIWVLDIKTMGFVYNSPSSVHILGYTPEESRRHKITDIVVPKYIETIGKLLNDELARDGQPGVDPGRSLILQLEQIHRNGSIVWTEMTLRFLRDGAGRPVSIVGVSRNITERKRTEQALAASEEKYRLLAETISDLIWIWDIRTRKFVYMNLSSEELLGYKPEETLALGLEDVMTPESQEAARKILAEETARDGAENVDPRRSRTFESELVHKNGTRLWSEITTCFLRDESGVPVRVLGITRDITKRKRIEMALAEREDRYRLLMENNPESLWVMDLRTRRFLYNNPYGAQILGYNETEAHNLTLKDILTPESFAEIERSLEEELARDGQPGVDPNRIHSLELKQVHRDGSLIWVDLTMKFLRDESGRPYSILGVSRDITPRKYAEELLLLQRDLARGLSATSSLDDAMALCVEAAMKGSKMDSGGVYIREREPEGMRLICHRGLGDVFINEVSYYGSETIQYRITMEGKPRYTTFRQIAATMNDTAAYEDLKAMAAIPIVHKGNVVANMNLASHTRDDIPEAARNILESIAAQIGDVIVRLETQESLKKSEEKFRKMIENSPIPIALLDNSDNRFTYFNKALVRTLGYTLEDVPDMDAWIRAAYPDAVYRKTVSGLWNKAAGRAMAQGTPLQSDEVDVRCRDGSYRHVDFRLMPMDSLSVIIMNDLTEKKIHQEMMIQTEKMTSLGGLAAGMAHEINNPLGIILQGIQATQNRLSPAVEKNRAEAERVGTSLDTVLAYLKNREVLDYLDGIQDAGQRAAKIVSNMLQFSRRSESVVAPVDVNQLIDKTIEIASNDYDLKKKYDFKKVLITREYDPDLGLVPCSETGIEQVVLNLLKNSSQAMSAVKKEGFQPAITIRTGREPGRAVITISDNGPGIDPQVKRHIFEPFYTTKGVGMGTGLGLSVSYYIVTKTHNGTIDVSSKPGEGAVFTIKLPLVRQP